MEYAQHWKLLKTMKVKPVHSELEWFTLFNAFENHSLAGLVYSVHQEHMPAEVSAPYRGSWIKQNVRNTLYLQELHRLGELIQKRGISLCLLKGVSLLETIYARDSAARFMSDIDLLVAVDHFEEVSQLIFGLGYEEVPSTRWSANAFKRNFTRHHQGVELVIELHSKLLWCESKDFMWEKIQSGIPGFHRLQKEHELVYLTAHLGYQHTFLHLGWLVDLDRLIRYHGESWNWSKTKDLATSLKVKNSFFGTLFQAHRYLETPIPTEFVLAGPRLLNSLATEAFLWNPHGHRVTYYLLKHLLKDNLRESLSYDFLWLMNRIYKNEKSQLQKK